MSAPGTGPFLDRQTGQQYYIRPDGSRQPAAVQALASRPRTMNPTLYPTSSQLHDGAGTSPPSTQQRRPPQDSVPYQPSAIVPRTSTVQQPSVPSAYYGSTTPNDSRLAGPTTQPQTGQWPPSTSPNARSAQLRSPQYSTAVPVPLSSSTVAAYSQSAYGPALGPPQGGELH